jgi:predicted AAA+ superfamily ATPase
MIDRYLSGEILARLNSGKALVIMGARQVGKTTLLK